MEDICVTFGKRVKKLREKKKFSQEEFSRKTGLHRTYLSDIECGNRNVSLKNIYKIVKALDTSFDNLMKSDA